jgi:hypothetical protein
MEHRFHRPSVARLPALTLCGCLLILALILSNIANPTSLGDSIRHLTLASLLRSGQSFQGWGDILYSGYFNTHNVDPWYLTHILLTPLGALDIVTAQKLFILLLVSVVGIGFLTTVNIWRLTPVTQSVLVCLLLFGHIQFSLRLLVGRPLFFMVTLTMFALLFVLQRHALPLIFLMIVATLLSHLFVFPLLVCLVGFLWLFSLSEKYKATLVLLCSIAGVCIGLFLHPQTSNYIHYIVTIFLKVPFLVQLNTSTEMHSGIGRMAPVFALFGAMILFAYSLRHSQRISWKDMHKHGLSLTAVIVTVMIGGMFVWVRMLDFLWPLLLVLLAQILSLHPRVVSETMQSILPQWALHKRLAIGVLVLFLTVHTGKIYYSFTSSDAGRALAHFAEPMKVIPDSARVLNIDWDLFPVLFSARPDLFYARGMDPSYDYLVDPESIGLFSTIRTSSPENIDWDAWLEEMMLHLPSDYLALWTENRSETIEVLDNVQKLEQVGMSQRIVVYKILVSPRHQRKDSV